VVAGDGAGEGATVGSDGGTIGSIRTPLDGSPIGAAALPRSSGSQSMTIRVLAGVRRTGEEGEGGEGTGDACSSPAPQMTRRSLENMNRSVNLIFVNPS
jgi:hypothetical protein